LTPDPGSTTVGNSPHLDSGGSLQLVGSQSWQIRVDRWAEAYDLPLWVRAAERIVAAGPLVPGSLEIDPLPEPTTIPSEEMAAGWLAWWESVVPSATPTFSPAMGFSPPDLSLSPPGFEGLQPWPRFQEVVVRRWRQAHDWHTERKRAGIAHHLPPTLTNTLVVQHVEMSLGRRVKPFVLELVLLPVRDDEIRQVHETRYLVPERVYDGPGWPDVLRPLVTDLGA
jgi:hypothetical protein